ncbi:MAG: class II glutamine amidotransferase [Solirubrobacteraceae bacterium]
MCRLFAMSTGGKRARATFWLLDAPDSLSVQSHRMPDGTGLGWYDERDLPLISKQPLAAFEDEEFVERAHQVSSRTFVAHVRFASTGELTLQNTHPFEQAGRLFAHNGVIEDLPALEARAGPAMTLVRGETDSERLFALITHEIAGHGGDVEEGIEAACRWVAANLPILSINFVLSTATDVWALRYPGQHELHVLERSPGKAIAQDSALGTRVRSDHGIAEPLVTIASEPMDADPAWRLLDSGELIHVAPTLEVSSRHILEEPPAHPLTLADLDARARASQAKVPA